MADHEGAEEAEEPGRDATTPPDTDAPEGFVQIATLGRTFKLDGGLRIYPLGDAERAALDAAAEARLAVAVEGAGRRALRGLRPHGRDLIVHLEGVRSVEAARELSNARVWAPATTLPDPPAGRAYLDALLGAPVALGDEVVGRVDEVWPGAQDLLHVRLEATGERRMVPLQAAYVRFDGERVELTDPPGGLLD